MPGVEEFVNSTGRGYGVRYFYGGNKSIRFNWKGANISAVTLDSVDVWDGTTRDPNWHMKFDSQASLVKTLPTIVDLLNSSFGQGTFYAIPADNLNEEIDLENFIVEGVASEKDAFDALMTELKPGQSVAVAGLEVKYGWRISKVLNFLRSTAPYESMFEKQGRSLVFKGTDNDIKATTLKKDEIMHALGAVKVTVTKGGKGEEYTPSDQVKEIESKGIERVAYEQQLEDLSILMKLIIKGKSNALFVAGRGGTGKALPNDAPVLTPDGWVRITDLQVGDTIITGNGLESTVTGVFPQGMRETAFVTFKDGRVVECDWDHLWEVGYYGWSESKVLSTREILSLREDKKWDALFTVPLFKPNPDAIDADLPVDPYLLGVLLGDGSLSNSSVGLTNADDEIIESVKSLIPKDTHIERDSEIEYRIVKNDIYTLRNTLTTQLRNLGLYGHVSSDKFIPEVYKSVASVAQKIRLIQGLIDTDGYVDKQGVTCYTTTSPQLAQDFAEVIYSLGGKARITQSESSYVNKNGIRIPCKDAYTVWVRLPNMCDLASLSRKKIHLNNNDQYSHVQLQIASITPSHESKECTCIKIDDPRGLFVTSNYVVTHNTQTVETELAKAGLQDGDGYYKNTGSASPIGIYGSLFDNKTGIVLFDDCDSALADQEGRNLIKAATDTKKSRKIAWNKKSSIVIPLDQYEQALDSADGERPTDKSGNYLYPNSFEFLGRVIFISNLKLDKLDPDGALRTRGYIIEIDPTDSEMIDYMAKIAPKIRLEDGAKLSQDEIDEVIAEIRNSTSKSDLSLRKLVRGLNIKAEMGGDSSWKRILQRYA